MSFITSNNIEERYNWVDVKELAESIFDDYDFEKRWIQDAWNLLMFNSVINEKNIISRDLNNYQRGDAIIWLITLYRFYFNYKCVIDYESAYYDHDVGLDGFATYRSIDLTDKLYNIEEGRISVTEYMWNDVNEKLNDLALKGEVPQQEFYDVENKCFSFDGEGYETIYNSEASPNDDSIAKIVLLEEIELRKEHFKNSVFEYFFNNTIEILDFLTTHRWIREYSDYKKRKTFIKQDYNFRKNLFLKEGNEGFQEYVGYENIKYYNVEEIEEEADEELKDLEQEYFEDTQDHYNYEYEILDWIVDGMNDL